MNNKWITVGEWEKTPWYLEYLFGYAPRRRLITSVKYPENYCWEYEGSWNYGKEVDE